MAKGRSAPVGERGRTTGKFITLIDVLVLCIFAFGMAGFIYFYVNPADLEKMNQSVWFTTNVFAIMSFSGVIYWVIRHVK